MLNTILHPELDKAESWIGNGTLSEEEVDPSEVLIDLSRKVDIVEQYGYIALLLSLLLIRKCAIGKFFSIEMLFFLLLCELSLSSVYLIWSFIYICTAVRFFNSNYKSSCS